MIKVKERVKIWASESSYSHGHNSKVVSGWDTLIRHEGYLTEVDFEVLVNYGMIFEALFIRKWKCIGKQS